MKRLFDVAMSIVGLILFSPLFVLLAVGIRLSSPGPIIYSQYRVGLNGQLFAIYKFRTMVQTADKIGSSVTIAQDKRITRFGRILRQLKLDELPQLWNVIRGDMSLVGPRPDVPEVVATYSSEMLEILRVRPGMTSIASLHLRNEEELLAFFPDPEEAYLRIMVPAKVEMAMEHVRRDSFGFDFLILLQTIWAITLGRWWALPEHPTIRRIRQACISQEE